MRNKKQKLTALLLGAVVALGGLALPALSFAAAGDPTLRFDLKTDDPVTGLKAGDTVKVDVTISRQDGETAPYDLYSIQLDIDYDSELFEVSAPKNAGLKRPDGKNWIGSWTCSDTALGKDGRQVGVLYTNIGGLISRPPRLDSVSGTLTAGSFLLTAKKSVPGDSSRVAFAFTESAGSDWKLGPSIVGQELTLQFAASDQSNGGGNNSNSGSGDASGNNSDSSGGSGGSSGGSSGGGSGGSSGGNSGSAAGGSGSSGSQEGSSSPNGDGTPSGASGTKVRFSDLTDVSDHWAASYIEYLVGQGIVSGNENKEFQPDQAVSRAEFAQMIASAFGYRGTDTQPVFFDVRKEDWYYSPVMELYQAGVVSGIGDDLFGSENSLSRQDMAVILSRAMKDQNVILPTTREYGRFTDESRIEEYARQPLWELYCTGVISGTGENTLSPEAETTRAQVAVVLSNVLKQTEGRR